MSRLRGVVSRVMPRSEFGRGVAVLVSGTAGAQLMLLLTVPILTRIYSPEQFGVLAVYAGILAPLAVFGCLRYELAIPLPEKEGDALRLVGLCFAVLSVFCLLVLLAIMGFRGWIAKAVNAPEIAEYLWFLPFGVLFAGSYQILKYWAIRKKDYKSIAKTTITQSVVSSAVQLGGYGLGTLALILGQIAGQSAGITRLAMPLLKRKRRVVAAVTTAGLVKQAGVYRHFPLYSSWSGVFNSLGVYLPSVLFAAFVSPAFAGLFALTQRVMTVPMHVLGGAIGSVFHGNGAEARREGRLGELFAGLHRRLALFAMPPALAIAMVGPEAFVFAFGAQWRDAGAIAQVLAPAFYFQFVIGPISTVFGITGHQRTGLMLMGFMLLTRVGGLVVGAVLVGFFGAVAGFSIATVVSYAVFLVFAFRAVDVPARSLVLVSGEALWRSVLWLAPLVIARSVSDRGQVLIVAGCLSVLLVIVGLRREFTRELAGHARS